MQLKLHMVTIEDQMPEWHFLRKLEAALDLSFVQEETAHLYSRRYGRPPIDPVVLVKYLLVGYLYGIPSERQIEQRIQTDVALRWYLGLDLFDAVPDHSTISQLRRRKPSFRKVFRRVFEEVVRQCIAAGLASGRLVGTDSTHVKASASRASEELVEMPEEPGAYWERLDAYEDQGLQELEKRTGRRRKKRSKQIKRDNRRTHKRVSRTDPEAGHMKRPGKPEGQYYLSHQTVDCDHGVILGVTVTPGDVHDSVPYLDHLEEIHRNILPIQAATADAAYDFPLAHGVLEEDGISFYVRPQPSADRTEVTFKRDAFAYDREKDVYHCPSGQQLRVKGLYRSASGVYWEYWAERSAPIWPEVRDGGRNLVSPHIPAGRGLPCKQLRTRQIAHKGNNLFPRLVRLFAVSFNGGNDKLMDVGGLPLGVAPCCQRAHLRIGPRPKAQTVKPAICFFVLFQPNEGYTFVIEAPRFHQPQSLGKLGKRRPHEKSAVLGH